MPNDHAAPLDGLVRSLPYLPLRRRAHAEYNRLGFLIAVFPEASHRKSCADRVKSLLYRVQLIINFFT